MFGCWMELFLLFGVDMIDGVRWGVAVVLGVVWLLLSVLLSLLAFNGVVAI